MRAFLGGAALLLLPLLVCADLWIARARGWDPPGSAGVAVYLATIFVVVLAVSALLAAPFRRFLARRQAPIVLLLASTVVGALLAETIAGRMSPPADDTNFHLYDAGTHRLFRPDPEIFPGVRGESHFRVNSLGIRGDEIPKALGAFRALAIGGSTTACGYLDQDEAWPYRLQQLLREAGYDESAWVGNIGRSGYGTEHHLAYLRNSSLLDHVDALILLVGMNDLMLHLRSESAPTVGTESEIVVEPFLLRSSIARLVRASLRDGPGMMVEDVAGKNYRRRRRARSKGTIVEAPPLDEARSAFRTRLVQIVELARERGSSIVLVTQPALWDEALTEAERELLWMGWTVPNRLYLAVEDLRSAIDRQNDVLLDVCAELEVACVDLRPMNGNPEYFYDDCHFTESGSAEVARRVAEVFLDGTVPR